MRSGFPKSRILILLMLPWCVVLGRAQGSDTSGERDSAHIPITRVGVPDSSHRIDSAVVQNAVSGGEIHSPEQSERWSVLAVVVVLLAGFGVILNGKRKKADREAGL